MKSVELHETHSNVNDKFVFIDIDDINIDNTNAMKGCLLNEVETIILIQHRHYVSMRLRLPLRDFIFRINDHWKRMKKKNKQSFNCAVLFFP